MTVPDSDLQLVRKQLASPFRDGWREAVDAVNRLEVRLAETQSREDFLTEQLDRQTENAGLLFTRAEAAEARLARLEKAVELVRSMASHNAERHTGFVHIGRILAGVSEEGVDERE